MEEQKKKSLWSWIKENPVTVGVSLISLTLVGIEGYYLVKTNREIGNLKEDNQALMNENTDLRGQLRATERENRKLGREIENSYYQLGKKSMTRS